MRSALALARRGLGNTWPNPSVGCIIVNDGRVVGRAVTAPGGRPHAEPTALAMAGSTARGATAYVTLEPCCHYGRTPPCTDALIAAGVARVVIGARDPDPRVNGQGVAKLRAAGITVDEGVLVGRGERGPRRLPPTHHHRPPAGDAETRLHVGRTHRHAMAARAAGSPASRGPACGARTARAARRHPGRRRHGVGGRSGPDLPPAGLPALAHCARGSGQPSAHAAHRAPGRHRARNSHLDADPPRHRCHAPRTPSPTLASA